MGCVSATERSTGEVMKAHIETDKEYEKRVISEDIKVLQEQVKALQKQAHITTEVVTTMAKMIEILERKI